MINKKRGQITLFIIIGILVVATAGIIYYVLVPKKIEVKELDVTAIREYVTSCLDSTAKNALVVIGMKGGYVEHFEGLDYVTIGETDVYYGITKPYLIDETTWYAIQQYVPDDNPFPMPPDYPWIGFSSSDVGELRPGLFGKTKLPSISYGDRSIQTQLKSYIVQNLDQCLDFSVFGEQGFEIEKGQKEVKVLIGLDSVVTTLTYPLKISKFEQKASLEQFSTTVNVRFGRIHTFIRNLILNDVSNIMFDIDNATNDYDGMTVSVEHNSNDLIIVMDSKSSLYGKPYLFRFMRENRFPALDGGITSCNGLVLKLNQNYFDPDEDTIIECMTGGTEDEWKVKICDNEGQGLCDWIPK